MTSFGEVCALRDQLEAKVSAASERLRAYPRGPMGMTPDSAKTPQWRADRRAFDVAFGQLRKVNRFLMKHYRKEVRAAEMARRAAKMASR